jgi:multiple sugar transport system permease protein
MTAAASPASTNGPAATGRSVGMLARMNDGRILMLPAILLLALMSIGPALYLFWSSLWNTNLLSPEKAQFVGLQNYVDVLTSPQTWNRFTITFVFVILAVSIELVLGLLLALLLDRPGIDIKVATSLLLLPMAVTPVVAALILRALLNPLYGWVDYYGMEWGLMDQPIEWLSQPLTAWIAVIGLDVWQWTSFVALILLAGLQGMDREPYEAAAIDGAGTWATFRRITLPMLVPFLVIAVLLRTIEAFKTFGTIQVLTNGGPNGSTEIVNLAIYRVALQNFQVGAGAALGIVFLVVVSVVASQLLRFMGRNTDLVED